MNLIGPDKMKAIFRSVQRLRLTEETLAARYPEQEMRTPTHFGVGQEAVATGVCEALEQEDAVYSHHRCHNHYLARGGSVHGLAAELYGRSTGCSGGRGGSVHLTAMDKGFVISSAILGQTVAVAVGSALAFKMDGARRVAVTFFGEATCEEGIVYESMNYAAVHRLPVLFVCENNLYSTESPLSVRQPAGTELCARARAFQIPAERVDGNDAYAVYALTLRLLESIRDGGGPAFMECMTYRWREHVGPGFDHELGRTYRTEAELRSWMERCPVERAKRRLIDEGFADAAEIEGWTAAIRAEVDQAIAQARLDPWPDPAELFDNRY